MKTLVNTHLWSCYTLFTRLQGMRRHQIEIKCRQDTWGCQWFYIGGRIMCVCVYKQVDARTGIPGTKGLYNFYVFQHGSNCYVGLMEFCWDVRIFCFAYSVYWVPAMLHTFLYERTPGMVAENYNPVSTAFPLISAPPLFPITFLLLFRF